MTGRLPPLRSIEAFVVVARTLSFTKAALELNITKSAVSRRIQALEADLGTRLLQRTANTVRLTASGRTYAEMTSAAFADLHRATRAMALAKTSSVVRVAVPESFASVWLMPRLSRFYAAYRGVELQFDSIGYFDQLDLRDVEVAIRVARSQPLAHHSEKLMQLTQLPICAPQFLEAAPIATVDDLAGRPVIVLTTMEDAWTDWLASIGRPDIQFDTCLRFDTMSLVIRAASAGLGIALGIGELCEAELAQGRLVAPFGDAVVRERALYFVCRKQDVSRRAVGRFRNWLVNEISSATA